MNEREMFEASFKRPRNYFEMSSSEQWKIDEELGILDWKGNDLSEKDMRRFKAYYNKKYFRGGSKMPGNSIKINGRNELEWYIGDLEMGELIATLDMLGSKTQDGGIFKDYGKALAESEAVDEEIFTKKELQKIRLKAESMAGVEGMNSFWVRAYLKVADACSHLDSMMVECKEEEVEEVVKKDES